MKIAIPHWKGRVSPVFDVSGRLLIVDIDNGCETCRAEVKMIHQDPVSRARDLCFLSVDLLICGVISLELSAAVISSGIKIIACTCGPVEEVVKAFLDNQLSNSRFLMPGCDQGLRSRWW